MWQTAICGVTAIFAPATSVRYASEPSGGGRVTVSGTDGVAEGVDFVYTGGTVTFTAIPTNGWDLSVWAGDAASCPASDWECALAENGDLRVTAFFSQAPLVGHGSTPPDGSGGRVTVSGTDGVIAEGVDFVYSGGTVIFRAVPAGRRMGAGRLDRQLRRGGRRHLHAFQRNAGYQRGRDFYGH